MCESKLWVRASALRSEGLSRRPAGAPCVSVAAADPVRGTRVIPMGNPINVTQCLWDARNTVLERAAGWVDPIYSASCNLQTGNMEQ